MVSAKVAWVIVEIYIFVVTSILLPGYALSLGLAPYLDQGEHSKWHMDVGEKPIHGANRGRGWRMRKVDGHISASVQQL